jgi:hypothetical protein
MVLGQMSKPMRFRTFDDEVSDLILGTNLWDLTGVPFFQEVRDSKTPLDLVMCVISVRRIVARRTRLASRCFQ